MPPPVIRITVDGKLALTVEQATQRIGASSPDGVRREISRYKLQHVAELDGKKKLYSAREFDAMWKARPGTGSPGKPRAKPKTSQA